MTNENITKNEELVKKKKCSKCEEYGEDLVDKDGFSIYIEDDKLRFGWNGVYEGDSGSININFCPECGRNLNEENLPK